MGKALSSELSCPCDRSCVFLVDIIVLHEKVPYDICKHETLRSPCASVQANQSFLFMYTLYDC